jgi:beta-glucanase (GH16 family)
MIEKKNILLLILAFFAIKTVLGQCPLINMGNCIIFTENPCNNFTWKLSSIGFTGNYLNPDDWNYIPEWGTGAPAPELASNVLIGSNGNLLLRATKEDPPLLFNGKYSDYTIGTIWSKTEKAFLYGKFEIKCKLPQGHGFWPAFFLFNGPGIEIDLFEFHGSGHPCDWYSHRIRTDVHYDFTPGYPPPPANSYDDNENCPEHFDGPDYSADMHIFTLIWAPAKIEFIVDGIPVREYLRYYNWMSMPVDCDDLTNSQCLWPNELYPDLPMMVCTTIGYDKNCTPDETTIFPAYMEIEYIKIWTLDNGCCIPYKLYEATDNLPTNTNVNDYIIAGNDAGISNISGSVTVKNGQNVSFSAGNEIKLLPGFNTEAGANFTAKIEPCNPLTKPHGDDIVIDNIPGDFSPDGDGINDKLCVSVNGATSYSILVKDKDWPHTEFYWAENVPIYSNPICVWNGSCNMNCGIYHECDRNRIVVLTFYNCDNSLVQPKTVRVNCYNKNLQTTDSLKRTSDNGIGNLRPTLDTEESNSNNYFNISPNPLKSLAQIDYLIDCSKKIELCFYNTTGEQQKRYSLANGNNSMTIDLSDLCSGVYSYRVFSENCLFKTGRIVVLK